MTLAEAQKLALTVLKEVMEEKVDENNVQLAQVVPRTDGSKGGSAKFEILTVEQVKEIMQAGEEVIAAAS